MVGSEEICALGDGDECADVIEEIDEEKDEDDFQCTEAGDSAKVEFECGVRRAERL